MVKCPHLCPQDTGNGLDCDASASKGLLGMCLGVLVATVSGHEFNDGVSVKGAEDDPISISGSICKLSLRRRLQQRINAVWHRPITQHFGEYCIHITLVAFFAQCIFIIQPCINDVVLGTCESEK